MYGLILEIIAQRPVAKHLEKSKMTGVSDHIYVSGTNALLIVGQSLASRVWFAKQIWHERMHACGCKKYRWIIFGNERLPANLSMASSLKEFNVFSAQFIDCNHSVASVTKGL